jgi:DNA-binding transcriptional ArsR family regulator
MVRLRLTSRNATARHLDEAVARALAHPLRQRILMQLEREVQTPLDLARALEQPLNKIGYHVHALREAGCIELVRTEHRRGAVAHFYRPTSRAFLNDEQWSSLPIGIRLRLVTQTLQDVMSDARVAAEGEGFDADDVHVSRTELALDDEGYAEIVELLGSTLDRALEIQAESVNRRASGETEADATAHRTLLGLLHFHRS